MITLEERLILTFRNPIFAIEQTFIQPNTNVSETFLGTWVFLDFLKSRKTMVSVTQKQYATLRNTKMYPHTKFWIPTYHKIQILSGLYLSRNVARGQGHRDLKTVGGTLWPIDVSTYQICDSMSYNVEYMLSTRILYN